MSGVTTVTRLSDEPSSCIFPFVSELQSCLTMAAFWAWCYENPLGRSRSSTKGCYRYLTNAPKSQNKNAEKMKNRRLGNFNFT